MPVTTVMAPKIRLLEEKQSGEVVEFISHLQDEHDAALLQLNTMLPVGCGAVSLHTRISLPREDGGSEEEGRSPQSQRAGDERHRGEAEGGQHEAVTAEENKQKQLVYHDDSVSSPSLYLMYKEKHPDDLEMTVSKPKLQCRTRELCGDAERTSC